MRGLAAIYAIAACVFLGFGTTSFAQQAVPLTFKFAPGDVLQYDITISGSGGLTAADAKATPVDIQGTCSLVQTVTKILPDGSGRIESRIPSGEVSIRFGQDQVRFSYANGTFRWFANGKEFSPPQADLAKLPLFGTPLAYTMFPDGRVSDIAFADPRVMAEVAKSLPGFDLSRISATGEPTFPGRPVSVGETWRSSVQLSPMGPALPLSLSMSRTLESYEDKGGFGLAKIVGFAEARYQGSGAPIIPAQDVSIGISELRQTITSTEYFNTTSGRLLRGDYDLAFSTQISAKAGDQEKSGGIAARIRVNVQGR